MVATATPTTSMNAPSEKDPFNNNCYGTTVDRTYKMVSLPVLDVDDFNERIVRGYEEGYGESELPADLSLARSLVPAGTASLRDFSYIAPEIPDYIPEQLHRLHGLRDRVPGHRHPRQGAVRGGVGGQAPDHPRGRPGHVPRAVVEDQEVLRWPEEEARRRRDVPHHHRPVQVQGVRRVRHGLRRRRPQDGRQDRRDHGPVAQEPPHLQGHGAVEREVHLRQPAHRHDAQGADAHLHRRGRVVCRLRRGDGPPHDVRGHGQQARRELGPRRGHRVQHGLHLDLPVQPVPGPVDQLAVRERPDVRDRRADALGPDGLEGPAAVGHRRRRGHVRYRLPGPLPPVRQRDEPEGVRPRHPGVLEHRRAGLDRAATPARTRR